ncbi:hypothetical protein E2I00_020145, partial [Balaenoptera physalus]
MAAPGRKVQAGPGTLIMAAGVQDFNRTEFDRLNEIKGHLEIALLEKHFLQRGAKPVTSFVKNLSALSDWYSVYTSAIAFTEPPKEDLTVSEKFQLVLDVAQKAQ